MVFHLPVSSRAEIAVIKGLCDIAIDDGADFGRHWTKERRLAELNEHFGIDMMMSGQLRLLELSNDLAARLHKFELRAGGFITTVSN